MKKLFINLFFLILMIILISNGYGRQFMIIVGAIFILLGIRTIVVYKKTGIMPKSLKFYSETRSKSAALFMGLVGFLLFVMFYVFYFIETIIIMNGGEAIFFK